MISMIGKEIIESEPISSAEVRKILEEFSQENELNYEQNITLNHLSRFKRYSVEDSEEIVAKLQEEFGLRDKLAVRIANLAPQDLADLRLILANKVILVEGPADDLIIQRAYLKKYKANTILYYVQLFQISGAYPTLA